jgi:uncharacterized protein YecT (DUF1311 family)
VRAVHAFTSALAAAALSASASADPILECRALAGDDLALEECLQTQLDISSRAMTEAQELARGAARQLDERTGTEGAVLGVEAAQQAWEAYRDVECQTIALFTDGGTAAQLACDIRLTRARTDAMLRLGGQGG